MQGRLSICIYDTSNDHNKVFNWFASNRFLKLSLLVHWVSNEEKSTKVRPHGWFLWQFSSFPALKIAGCGFLCAVDCLTGHKNAHMHAEALTRCTTEINSWQQTALLPALNFYCCCVTLGLNAAAKQLSAQSSARSLLNNPGSAAGLPWFQLRRPAHPSCQPTVWLRFRRVFIFHRFNK